MDTYPLTPQAAADHAAWDRVAENPYMRCENGMPAIMDQFYPTEFVLQGDKILIYLEEQDVVRTIHMADVPPTRNPIPPTGTTIPRRFSPASAMT